MKKLGSIILGVIIGAGAMYYYCQNFGDYDIVDSMVPIEPKGTITPAQITAMTEAYNPRYDTIASRFFRGVKGGDNRSSWYSLDELNNFLESASDQAQDMKYTMTGVRIYLGVKERVGDIPGYTTMLLVPTGYEGISEGSMFNFMAQPTNHDIPGANGLDMGEEGSPPGANYPQ